MLYYYERSNEQAYALMQPSEQVLECAAFIDGFVYCAPSSVFYDNRAIIMLLNKQIMVWGR